MISNYGHLILRPAKFCVKMSQILSSVFASVAPRIRYAHFAHFLRVLHTVFGVKPGSRDWQCPCRHIARYLVVWGGIKRYYTHCGISSVTVLTSLITLKSLLGLILGGYLYRYIYIPPSLYAPVSLPLDMSSTWLQILKFIIVYLFGKAGRTIEIRRR